MVLGENGIFSKAQEAKRQTNVKSAVEDIRIAILEAETRVQTEEGKKAELKDLIKELENKADTYLIKLSDGSEFASLDTSGIGVLDVTYETPAIKITNLSTYKIEVSVSKDFRIACDGIEVAVTPTTPGGGDDLEDPNSEGTDDQTATVPMIIEKGQTTARPITTEDYGKKVSYLNADGSGQMAEKTWRLFYVEDSNNTFGDGNGTIYLKADWWKNAETVLTSYDSTKTLIRKLNPKWANGETSSSDTTKRGEIAENLWNDNEKAAARLCDTSVWEPIYKSTNSMYAGKINWVVGAPSAEMFTKSYSQKVSEASNYDTKYDNSRFPGYTFTTDGNKYQFWTSDKSIGYTYANGMYLHHYDITEEYGICTYWLASPSCGRSDGLCIVAGTSAYLTVTNISSTYVRGFPNSIFKTKCSSSRDIN